MNSLIAAMIDVRIQFVITVYSFDRMPVMGKNVKHVSIGVAAGLIVILTGREKGCGKSATNQTHSEWTFPNEILRRRLYAEQNKEVREKIRA
jgi:ABC-type dipeptide/oligopeptide/nickel transport system ATPase component